MDSEKVLYKYIGTLAIKYRLSLSSIKSMFIKYLGNDITLDEICNKIMKYCTAGLSDDKSRVLSYLFTETTNESFTFAALSRKHAKEYIDKYGTMLPRELRYIEKDIEEAQKSSNTELLQKLNLEKEAYYELNKEEIEYYKFKKDYLEGKKSLASGLNIIAAYRIKNAISQMVICDELLVDRRRMYNEEQKMTDVVLIAKLSKLSDFISGLYDTMRKRENRRK